MSSVVKWGPYETVRETARGWWGGSYHDEVRNSGVVNRGYDNRASLTKSDHVSPTFYSREVVNTLSEEPYSTRERDIVNGEVRADYVQTQYISLRMPDPAFWGYPGSYQASMTNAEDRSVTIARERLGQRDQFNVGVSLGEAVATAEMLASTGGRMANGLIQVRRLLGRGKGKVAAALAGAWLEGYYGWRSLANDGFDLYNRLNRQINEPLHIRASCTSRVGKEYHEPYYWDRRSKWNGFVKVAYTARLDDEFSRNATGWGLTNPLSIAWELVPFSFCVDWLVPIGNTLSSLTATAGLSFERGYMTTVSEATYNARFVNSNPWSTTLSNGHINGRIYRFDRRPLSGFLLPRLYANENPFSTNRIISGLSLISQAILGR